MKRNILINIHGKIAGLALVISSLLMLNSCNKFLEKPPSKTSSLEVTTTDQLYALLGNYSNFYKESNRFAIYGSDDNGINKELYDARPATFSLNIIQTSLWDIENLPTDNTTLTYWGEEYKKIFMANEVLDNLDRVTGSKEDKDNLRAEAHFIRAYSYFNLANTYCLPYTEANKNAQGLPIKSSVSFEESANRAPLSKVYELIESDLQEALKIKEKLVQNGVPVIWHSSTAAVNAFAARYYLQMNNYTEALKYADLELGEYSVLVDYNTEMRYGKSETFTIDGGTPNQKKVTVKYPYTHDDQLGMTDRIGWKEFIYFRILTNTSEWYIPSQQLLSLYDTTNDLRYRYHMVKGFSYKRGMTKPSYDYPGYIFFYNDGIPSGPTTAEMYLIRAECLARLDRTQEAMDAVNILHSKRMVTGTPELVAANKEEAIKVILEERRREMPFTKRMLDLRRFNNNEDPNDDVLITRQFYPYNAVTVDMSSSPVTYTLEKNSKKYAAPLPMSEIESSRGVMEQNTY